MNRDANKPLVNPLFTHTGVGNRPVIYAGRFVDLVAGVNLPSHYSICGEKDVPSQFSAIVDKATALVVLDLRSFPFKAMTEKRWDVPLVVVLPLGLNAESLTIMFGTAIFERLEFFDRIATPDSDVWKDLRRRYRWAENQRIELETDAPGEVAVTLCTLLETGSTVLGGDECEEAQYWEEDSDFNCDPRFIKALHRLQAEVLKPRFEAARGERPDDVPFEVLEIGTGVGRWAGKFDPKEARFSGVDRSKSMIRAARYNFPDRRFDQLSPNLLIPYDDDCFDLVFGVDVVQRNPSSSRRTLLSEMWRVARPAGRLLFLEKFVTAQPREKSSISSMSVLEFVDLILEETSGQVVLEHVEALRYPYDELFRGGVISLLKLGVPKT